MERKVDSLKVKCLANGGGVAEVGMSIRIEIFLYFSTLKLSFFPFLDLKV